MEQRTEMNRKQKIKRLVAVARLYYEEDRTQNEIAQMLDISRPMVSRLLKEAKKIGIVTIEISEPEEDNMEERTSMLELLHQKYGIRRAVLIKSGVSNQITDRDIAQEGIYCLERFADEGKTRFGIGWGHMIGEIANQTEKSSRPLHLGSSLCPLIGNGGAGLKNYHSNELVRSMSEHSQAEPVFLYTPAYMTNEQDLRLIKNLKNYQEVYQAWQRLEVALVNIGNFPSSQDFASRARYGNLLEEEKAAGRLLNYFVGSDGHVIRSESDYAVQIPLTLLKKTEHVVGICSASITPGALTAALKSGYIHELIAPENIVKKIL